MNASHGQRRTGAGAAAVLALLAALPAGAQNRDANPLAPPDTSSPRATLRSFIDNADAAFRPFYLGERDVEPLATPAGQRATRCLDLSGLPPAQAKRLAAESVILLIDVLGRVPIPPDEEIPDLEEMAALPEGTPRAWRVPGTSIEIAEAADGPRKGEFLFTPHTVRRARDYYQLARRLPYQPDAMVGLYERVIYAPGGVLPRGWIEALPYWTRRPWGNQAPWQWAGLAIGIAVWVLAGALAARLAGAREGRPRHWRTLALTLAMVPATLALRRFVDVEVKLVGLPFDIVDAALVLAAHLIGSAGSVRLGAAVGESIIASPRVDPRSIDAHLIRLVAGTLGWIGAVALALAGAAAIGVPLTALVTGLGVGGFAFALAARPTLENLVAGVTLFIDRPVRVGTFCAFDGIIGQVEEIGIRSTKVRRWGGNRITIPNAQFAELRLDNYDDTQNLWIRATLGLRYETTPDQLRFVLAKIRELLFAHPRLTGTPRARLAGFGDYCLNIEILTYADTGNWMEWHAIREDLFLHIMDIIDESGTSFAFPSQTTYLARDKGLDAQRSQQAEDAVRAWRDEDMLPFPDMAQADMERLRGSVEFPPHGSVARQPPPAEDSPPDDI